MSKDNVYQITDVKKKPRKKELNMDRMTADFIKASSVHVAILGGAYATFKIYDRIQSRKNTKN